MVRQRSAGAALALPAGVENAKGLRLIITRNGHLPRTQFFRSFPVRIGRDLTSDCVLVELFVSRAHARIELEGDKLVLHDENSQSGTSVQRGTQLVQGGVGLADVGHEFAIGSLGFRAELIPLDAEAFSDVDRVLENARELLNSRRDELGTYVLSLVSGLNAPDRERALCSLVRTFPELRQVASVAELISTFGVTGSSPAADAAHAGLESLRSKYVPGADVLDRAEDVTGFVTRLDAAFGCLIEGVAGLIVAYGYEIANDGIVSTSRGTLAERLLGEDDERAVEQLRGTFVAMLRHHTSLTHEAVTGFQALVDELAPPRGWFVERARWQAYAKRRASLATLSASDLSRRFGPTFARVCAALADGPKARWGPSNAPEIASAEAPR